MTMQDSVFSKGIKKLEAAFRHQSLSQNTLEIYFAKLREVDDGTWLGAIESIINREDFFPSISCLMRYCSIEPSYDAAGRILKIV